MIEDLEAKMALEKVGSGSTFVATELAQHLPNKYLLGKLFSDRR